MKRMWQKYTPGKRVLALLLAVLMLCDTFTVSAATTEGEVSTEVVEVTDEVTEPEENLVEEEPGDVPEEPAEEPVEEEPVDTDELTVEEPEAEEPVVDAPVIEETTENGEGTTELEEVVEEEVEQLTTDGLTLSDIDLEVRLFGWTLGEDKKYVYGVPEEDPYNPELMLVTTQADVADMLDVTVADKNGNEIPVTYTGSGLWPDSVYYQYDYDFNMTDNPDFVPAQVKIKNNSDETDVITYEVAFNMLYGTDSSGTTYKLGWDAVPYSVGDTYELSTYSVEEGAFGYIIVTATDSAVVVSTDNMSAEAKMAWDQNYKETYATYGAAGRYYFFTYGDGEVYYPTLKVQNGKGATIEYRHKTDIGFNYLMDTSIYVTDYHLEHNGNRLYETHGEKVNYADYNAEGLRFDVCNGEQAYTGSISISSYPSILEDAISVKTDENGGQYVYIDTALVKNYSGEVVGLSQISEKLYFTVQYDDISEEQRYDVYPDGIQFYDRRRNEGFLVSDGNEISMVLNDNFSVSVLDLVWLNGDEISNFTLTSSNESVLALHGEQGVELGENSVRIKSTFLEAKKVGTSDLKVSFVYKGVTYTKTVHVKVELGAEKPGFGYYNDNNEFIPFVDGETIDIEQGDMLRLYTNISPRLLSGISVKSSNTSLVYTYGTISETFYYDEIDNYGYYRTENVYCNIREYSTGKVTLTMSAKYAGRTYTQKVTLNVIEPKGLQIRNAYTSDGEWYGVSNGRLTNIHVGNQGLVRLVALYDDNENGATVPADKDNYTIEVWGRDPYDSNAEYELTDDFEIVFVNEYVFYILPPADMLDYYLYECYKIRVTPNEQTGEEAEYIEVGLEYSPETQIYLSYNEETHELSDAVSELYFVEGEDTAFYAKIYEGDGETFGFSYGNGLVMKESAIVYRDVENSQVIVKFVVSNDGSFNSDYQLNANIVSTDRNYYITDLNYRLLDATECTAPVATQRQISDFLNAEDASCDISGVRIQDYVVALKTAENGTKSAVIMGYVGSDTEVSMPDTLNVFQILAINATGEHTLSNYASIPVIGLDDGVFDTAKGYTQPENVSLYAGYTYLGTDYTGWVNPDSGIRTAYEYWWNDNEYEAMVFDVINNMVFATVDDQYICVDTGNANFAAVVPEGVVLYKNRTSGHTAIDLVKANSVSYYSLAKDYLYMVEGTGAAIEVPVKVEAENGQYYLSIDNTHENAAMLADLASGVYYMDLVPVITIEGQEITLAAQKCEVVISFENVAPEVKIQNSNISINTYLGDTALTKLDVSNSFGTAVTNIVPTEASAETAANAGLTFTKNGDGVWMLYWDGTSTIPKNTKIEVEFEVEGFTPDADVQIATQTITVNGKSTQPKTTLSATSLTFKDYPYSSQSIEMNIKDGNITNRINPEYTKVESAGAPKGGDASDVTITLTEDRRVTVDVHNNAVPGTYKFKITPALAAVRGGDYVPYYASAVTLTVNVKGTKPTIKFAEKLNVTLNSNFYNVTETLPGLAYATAASEQVSQGVMYDPTNNVNVVVTTKSTPKNADASLVKLTPYYGGATGENVATGMYELSQITFVASVESGATAGSYTFDIKVPVIVQGDVVWMTTTATVKVVNTLPTFKLSESTITLDAAYPYEEESDNINYSSAEIRLVMDEGYRLAGAQYTWGTNYNAYECIDITYNAEAGNGTIYFDVVRAGLTKGGTVTLTPRVIAPSGEELTLKPVKVNVKVTNTSKVTLNAKVKAATVNPYLGTVTTKAQLSTKGFAEVAGLDYTYSYDFVPVDKNAYLAEEWFAYLGVPGLTVSADGSEIYASNWEGLDDGKYTYNLVEKITASNGDVTYTKPVTFTVTVKEKALTIVPQKTNINFYYDMGNLLYIDGTDYFMVAVPVSIKELPGANVMDCVSEYASNSKEDSGVVTYFAEDGAGGTCLVVCFPWQLYNSMKGLKVTAYAPEDVYKEYATFTVNINYKNGAATSFKNATVTLDRYTAPYAENTLLDGESFATYGMEVVSITKKGSKEDIKGQFTWEVNEVDGSANYIKVAPKNPDTIANGTYIVTVKPIVGVYEWEVDEETNEVVNGIQLYYLNKDCSFNLNITQPKLSLSVSEKIVNLYPDLGEVTSSVSVNVLDGTTPLQISKLEVVGPTSKIKTGASVGEDNRITFGALSNQEGGYASGSDVYTIKAYVKNYNGTADVLAGTISKAVTVNVKTLPTKVTLTNTKLTFSPYLEQNVITSVKDAELAALMASGDYSYSINVVETNNKYKELAEDKKNDVIVAVPDENGNIAITKNGTNFPEKNATYYYTATIIFQKDGAEVAKYSANFQVAVKNTKPVAALQQANVTLNNAYLEQFAYNRVSLTTGNSMWTLTAQDSWDIVVKDSKNKDITDKEILKALMYDASGEGEDAIYTNDVVVGLWTADERGIIDVPKGNYKISITPKVTDGINTIDLAPVTMTVKVISNRPTVKFSGTKVTLNTYNNIEQSLKLTMSNGGDFVAYNAECTKFPQGVTTDDGITFNLAADGTLTVKADRTVKAGSYTYKFTPVTVIDGYGIALDAKTITVAVNNTLPTAVLSSSKVTVNSLFAGDYYATIDVTAKNAGKYQYVFYTDAIKFADTKSTKQTVRDNAAILLDNMEVELYENGKATIVVMLPEDKTVANGTYKFTLTPSILTGDESNPSYDLKPVSFSVVVENKKPTLSAKVVGSIDLVNMNKNAAEIQLSFNKQNYETIGNMDGIRILDKGTGDDAWQFRIDYVDWGNGKIVLTNSTRLPAGKSYALQVEVTSTTGQVYLANCTVKTAQANYKITAGTAYFYTAINSGGIKLSATDGVYLDNVEVLKVTTDKAGKKAISGVEFDGRLGADNTVEIWSNGNLPSSIKKGSIIYVQLEVTPYGLATNKQPTKITVPVTVK